MTLITFELLQRASILEGDDDTDIKWLFNRALDWKRAADTHIGYAFDSAERSRGANQNILIVGVAGPLKPEKDDVRNLPTTRRESLD